MLKLSTSYSKKIPVPGQEYSSQSFHCAVELELSDSLTGEQLRDQIHQTFTMVRRSVENEIGRPDGTPESRPSNGNGNGGDDEKAARATNRQIKFILDLARDQGLGLNAVNDRVRTEYGVDTVYSLDRKTASRLVDQLKAA